MADLIALDPTLSGRENLRYELAQHKETGHDTTAVERALSRLPNDAPQEAFWELFDALAESPRVPDWPYVEPSTYDEIVATLPVVDATPPRTWSRAELTDRVLGGWLGRIAGCNLGKPIEWDEHWTRAHIRSYLESVGAYPLLDYVPKADDVSERYRFLPNWTETTRGRVHGSARDDDLDYSIIGLHLLERWGRGYTSEDVAGEWLLLLPILQTGAERVNLRNLVAGLRPPLTASHHNPHREWVGALIAAAFTAADAREAVAVSVEHIPPTSRLAEAVRRVLGWYDEGRTWDEAQDRIDAAYGHYHWVHTINNAAAVAAGLLWAEGDFSAAVGLTVQAGRDTDSAGATAGSVAGILAGATGIPAHWVDRLEDRVATAVFGYDNVRISDLAARTVAFTLQ